MPETMPATVGGPTLRRVWMCGLGACWKLTAMASPRGSAAGIGGTGWPDSTRRVPEPCREPDAILGLALPTRQPQRGTHARPIRRQRARRARNALRAAVAVASEVAGAARDEGPG